MIYSKTYHIKNLLKKQKLAVDRRKIGFKSFNKYWLSIHQLPGSILNAEDTVVSTEALLELSF